MNFNSTYRVQILNISITYAAVLSNQLFLYKLIVMRRLFTLAMVLLFGAATASAQYYLIDYPSPGQNPGNINNDPEQPWGFLDANLTGYTQIMGSSPTATWSSQQNLPFNFNFNGVNQISYYVSSNGVLTFASNPGSAPSNNNGTLPDASLPDNSICAWGLNIGGGNDAVVSKTFGTAPNRQHWVIYASASEPGIQGWTYWGIVLEEGTNNVYVVDMRTFSQIGGNVSMTVGIQFDNANALSVGASPNVTSVNTASGGNGTDASDNAYYAFIQGQQPDNDVAVNTVVLDAFLKIGDAPFDITGELRNLGAQPLTSMDLNYSINGGAPVTDPVSGLTVAPGATYNYTAPTSWTPSSTGVFEIKVWSSSPNGQTDGNPADDTASITIEVVDQFYQRMPLYETFTSSTCPPCAPGNANFHSQLAGKDGEYVSIKYQQNFPGAGDPYGTDEAVNRRNFYGITGIPALVIDGQFETNSNSFTVGLHEAARAIPSFVDIKVEYEVDEANQRVDFEVEATALKDYGQVDLYVAILEAQTFNNVATNGETEFEQVMKKMVPSENGQSTTLSTTQSIQVTDAYTFQGSYRQPANYAGRINHATEHSVEEFDDLYVVAWVQDPNTDEVYQAAVGTEGINVGIEAPMAVNTFELVPNPAQTQAALYFSVDQTKDLAIDIFNNMGQHVAAVANQSYVAGEHNVQLNLSDLASGVYFVRIMGDDVATTKRLSVVK